MDNGIGYLYIRIASDAFEERRNIERQLTSRDVPSIRRDGSAAYAVVCVTCPDVQRSFTSGVLATVSATTLRAVNTWRILRATRESRVITTMLHETFLSLSLSLRPFFAPTVTDYVKALRNSEPRFWVYRESVRYGSNVFSVGDYYATCRLE